MRKTTALIMRYMPMMVTCEEANRFIDDYLSGELPRRQRLVFDWHIRLCSGCSEYLQRYRSTIDLCRENFYGEQREDDEDAVPEQILKGIVAAKRAGED